jgi:cytochrome c553
MDKYYRHWDIPEQELAFMQILDRIAVVALAAVLLAAPPAVAQQDAQALHVRSLAATCANCHGTEGQAHPDGAVPSLSGMPGMHLKTRFREFRDGKRPATVMHQLAKGYTDEQIDAIAAYFAGQKK